MAGQCHGTKRKESSTNAHSRLLRPGDLAKATKKLLVANKKRLKRLGLPPTAQPTSPTAQETRPVVQQAPPAVQETRPVVQPAPTVVQSTPQAVQETQSVVQHSQVAVPAAAQATAPTATQATTPHSLEERDHLQDVNGGQRDTITKIKIRPFGRGFTPSKAAANAMKMAIREKFREVYECWKKVPQEEWFKTFSDCVSWEPQHDNEIRGIFNIKCPKRLTDMLTKVRNKREKPLWMGEDAYKGLLDYWKSEEFKKLSSQNKTNRGSKKGGALHTTGRKAHHDLALDLGEKIGRPVYPDELFLVTHKKKSGDWVDNRAKKTYDDYQERLTLLIKTNDHSLGDTQEVDGQEVDGETRLSLWVDVAGGISRGQCYGTGVMSVNIRPGVCHLTHESRPLENALIEMLRREAAAARAEAVAANERADAAVQLTKKLENDMANFAQRMAALENQSGGGSCNTSRPRPTPQHPHYDDDLDDQSEDDLT